MNEPTHEETAVRHLLRDAAACLPAARTDLFANVSAGARRRRRRRRRRLTLFGIAGAVLVVAGGASAVTTLTDRHGDTERVQASSTDRPCPAQLEPLSASQRPEAAGVMVPASPVSAQLCVYAPLSSTAPGSPEGLVPARSGPLSGPQLNALVASLDAAPKGAMRCIADADTVAAVRFVYASGPDVEVRIGVDSCRNASNGSRDVIATAVTVPVPQDAAQRAAAAAPTPPS
ncbi:hypothetical protein [Kitasatospora azatica]|uniref:hypothetical protein n=1 Tax=Kitasatospora azatica TaxID=58347 RepID=UPI00068AA6E3|nr:hypothetical protein [Kitasatospora azatica]